MNSIALLGQPNSGKSTVFNQLTGSRQHVGNWPGKTVEKKDGSFTYNNIKYNLTDLPGSYGLTGNSDEEKITVDYIRSGKADLVCVLVDASQLQRSMYMLAEFAEMNVPAVVLLNMIDVAKDQHKEINAELIEKRLGVPVIPFVAADKKYYDNLKNLLVKELNDPHMLTSRPDLTESQPDQVQPAKGGSAGDASVVMDASNKKYEWVNNILDGAVTGEGTNYKLSKFDRIVTRPVLGKVICLGIILAAFLVAMLICAPFMSLGGMIPGLISGPIASLLNGWNVHPWLVSIFSLIIPNTLYFCISMAAFVLGVNLVFGLLEEVGFIARAAYQFDNVLSRLGLQGKAIAPILMGFGCTIGGASGTRVMDNWGQRMLAMAVVWAVPCGSIWSIIPVISGMFFPWWGVLLICVGILVYVVILMFIVSKIFGKKLSPETGRSGMVMELPPYHKPHWGHIIKEAFYKAGDIFVRALRTVFIMSIIFWIFSYTSTGNIENSLLYRVGTFIEPVTKFFGLGWQSFMSFISSAFAKEAVLGVLNAVFVGQSNVADVAFNVSNATVDNGILAQAMTSTISQAEALALMFACTFNVPCVMALSTTYRESHSFKWTAAVAVFYVLSALLLSCIVYHIAALFLGA